MNIISSADSHSNTLSCNFTLTEPFLPRYVMDLFHHKHISMYVVHVEIFSVTVYTVSTGSRGNIWLYQRIHPLGTMNVHECG